jgi:hypothetical protein
MPKVTDTYNLKILHPAIAAEWHPDKNGGLSPQGLTPGSGRKVWWLCNIGHEWQATLRSRIRGSGCPFCEKRGSDTVATGRHDDITYGLLKDFSSSGMHIETDYPIRDGEKVVIRIKEKLTAAAPTRFGCRVRWCKPLSDGEGNSIGHSVGLKIIEGSADQRLKSRLAKSGCVVERARSCMRRT